MSEYKVEMLVFRKGMRARVLVNGQTMVELVRSSPKERCGHCERPSQWRPINQNKVKALCEDCIGGLVMFHVQEEQKTMVEKGS